MGPTIGTPITKDPTMEPSAGPLRTSKAPGNGPSPPPGLFTTEAETPVISSILAAIIRVRISSKSPGGHGTTNCTGVVGYSAWAGSAPDKTVDADKAAIAANFFISKLPILLAIIESVFAGS